MERHAGPHPHLHSWTHPPPTAGVSRNMACNILKLQHQRGLPPNLFDSCPHQQPTAGLTCLPVSVTVGSTAMKTPPNSQGSAMCHRRSPVYCRTSGTGAGQWAACKQGLQAPPGTALHAMHRTTSRRVPDKRALLLCPQSLPIWTTWECRALQMWNTAAAPNGIALSRVTSVVEAPEPSMALIISGVKY